MNIWGIVISGMLQLGIVPGNQMALYSHLNNREMPILACDQTIFVDYQCEAIICKYIFLNGGFTSYSLKEVNGFDFYPFRQDYIFGGGLQYGIFRLVYLHGCYHGIFPNMNEIPFPKIDGGNDRYYLQAKPEVRLKNLVIGQTFQFGFMPAHGMMSDPNSDTEKVISVPQNVFLNCQVEATFWKYFFIDIGAESYSRPTKNISFRQYYDLGIGAQYKGIRLGYSFEHINKVAPVTDIPNFPNVDKGYSLFYLQAEFGGSARK